MQIELDSPTKKVQPGGKITINLKLPEETHLNQNAPNQYWINSEEKISFDKEQIVVTATNGTSMKVNLKVYYCQGEEFCDQGDFYCEFLVDKDGEKEITYDAVIQKEELW